MKIVFSEKCLQYNALGHPESPLRVKSTYIYLKEKGFSFVNPDPVSEEELLLVHSPELIASVKNLDFSDADTPRLEGMFEYASLSAGAAVVAMKLCLEGENAFSLCRPPGHHAGRNFLGGFCYFNNIALAVQKAVNSGKRAAILDIDCHHGNGTQDIFLNKPGVLYISLHQSPLYPGTGLSSEGNCLNYFLSRGTGENEYLDIIKEALVKIKEFSADIIAISAGFDTYKADPLAQMGLDITSYGKIHDLIKACKIPYFSVLEGGYSRDLKNCVYEFLR